MKKILRKKYIRSDINIKLLMTLYFICDRIFLGDRCEK